MKEILKKYVKGECSGEEFKKAVMTLAGLTRQGALHDFMDSHWKALWGEEIKGNPSRFSHVLDQIHHQINISERKLPFTFRLYKVFSKIAAILVLPLIVMATLFVLEKNEADVRGAMTEMTVPAGIQSHIELPDGTDVWLNSESQISFPANFEGYNQRKVRLIGEGYFEVTQNKKKPFIVSAGEEMNVQVTGTTFNLSAYENEPEISVALIEGGVKIQDNECKTLAEIRPSQVAYFYKGDEKINITTQKNMSPYVAWKEGKFVFNNEPFESVLRTMERKYNVKYRIEDARLKDYRITATFLDETLEEFLKVITTSSPIDFEIHRPKQSSEVNAFGKRVVVLTKK